MKTFSTKAIAGLMLLVPAISASAIDYLPTNDFFTDGQSWRLQRIPQGGDASAASELIVTVDGEMTASGELDYNGTMLPFEEYCKRLVVTENGVETGVYAAFELNGRILVKSDKKNEFVPVLDFNCANANSLNVGSLTYTVASCDYLYQGNLLRKRVNCSGTDDMKFVYGIGADKWTLNEEYWPGNFTYSLVSMTTAEDAQVSADDLSASAAECDNAFWTQDKRWDYYTFYPAEPDREGFHNYWKIDGTITLGNKNGSMICPRYVKCNADWTPVSPENSIPVVSIGGQVYQYDSEYERFLLSLDFDIETGEQALREHLESIVKEEDMITVRNREYKRITFMGADSDSSWQYWVEGIGANGRNMLNIVVLPSDGSDERLDAVYQGGVCLFTYGNFRVPSAIGSIADEESVSEDGRIFDIPGRLINDPAPGTVIIRDGKKSIVR